jgi:hypothetical protein
LPYSASACLPCIMHLAQSVWATLLLHLLRASGPLSGIV